MIGLLTFVIAQAAHSQAARTPHSIDGPNLHGVWSYEAGDGHGKKVAWGTIVIRKPRGDERKRLRIPPLETWIGAKTIVVADARKYGPHGTELSKTKTGSSPSANDGSYVSIEPRMDGIHMDLNRNFNDHNIQLNGRLNGKTIAGTWGWSTFAGVRARGTFKMVRLVDSE